jgi:ferritin-like metal-binding protein YciE
MANLLGNQEAVSLLEETLEEEKETDSKLTELAEGINVAADKENEPEAESESESHSSRRRKPAA